MSTEENMIDSESQNISDSLDLKQVKQSYKDVNTIFIENVVKIVNAKKAASKLADGKDAKDTRDAKDSKDTKNDESTDKKWDMASFENAIGVNAGTLSRIKAQKASLSLGLAIAISKYLEVPLSMLVDAELSYDDTNTALRYIEKLIQATKEKRFVWQSIEKRLNTAIDKGISIIPLIREGSKGFGFYSEFASAEHSYKHHLYRCYTTSNSTSKPKADCFYLFAYDMDVIKARGIEVYVTKSIIDRVSGHEEIVFLRVCSNLGLNEYSNEYAKKLIDNLYELCKISVNSKDLDPETEEHLKMLFKKKENEDKCED